MSDARSAQCAFEMRGQPALPRGEDSAGARPDLALRSSAARLSRPAERSSPLGGGGLPGLAQSAHDRDHREREHRARNHANGQPLRREESEVAPDA